MNLIAAGLFGAAALELSLMSIDASESFFRS